MGDYDKQNINTVIDLATVRINKSNVELTEQYLDNEIDAINTGLNYNLSEDKLEIVKRELLSRHQIKMDDPFTIREGNDDPWFDPTQPTEEKYWNRYSSLLISDKEFSLNVVNTLDRSLNEILSNLANPNNDTPSIKRGLVLGDVQSGKTATYTGLICKAADLGYKVFILLTGVMEDLRRQTQFRLDEGFVGVKSEHVLRRMTISQDRYIGVGKIDKSGKVVSLTSTEIDFKASSARILNFDLSALSYPVLFVIKKNTSVLNNLYSWLKTKNADPNGFIKFPMLLIDDESDNASLNTNKEDENPTAINSKIRALLSLFYKSNYIGFTATPFANIFINPDTDDDMLKEDLFPKDFITVLSPPSNYIGISSIFDEDGAYEYIIRHIDDLEEYLPIKHKKDYMMKDIPKSLRDAIYAFLLVNTIKDLKNNSRTHRSMLINISRFTKVQNRLSRTLSDHLENIRKHIKVFGQKDDAHLQSEIIAQIRDVWRREYSEHISDWSMIQSNLYDSTHDIEVVTVNSSTSKDQKLNYQKLEHEKTRGLRVIVVGGLSLSRGLTLEGLTISYFYRHSRMYDTLLQMARWFGYRKGYEDLCRIWLSRDLVSSYGEIAQTIAELKDDLRIMRAQGKTPKDFGLRIRSSVDSLLVTAPNKMRHSTMVIQQVSLSEAIIETPFLYADADKNNHNFEQILDLLKNASKYESGPDFDNNTYTHINRDHICHLFNNLKIPEHMNIKFNVEAIVEFINRTDSLMEWDVAFIKGSSDQSVRISSKHTVTPVVRAYSVDRGLGIISISSKHRRLGGVGDTKYGLQKNEIEAVEKAFYKDHPNIDSSKKKKSLGQKAYLHYMPKRRPLLMVYLIDLKNEGESRTYDLVDESQIYIGISIGIPSLNDGQNTYVKYRINLQKVREMMGYDDDDE
jgi:hypothetical protein